MKKSKLSSDCKTQQWNTGVPEPPQVWALSGEALLRACSSLFFVLAVLAEKHLYTWCLWPTKARLNPKYWSFCSKNNDQPNPFPSRLVLVQSNCWRFVVSSQVNTSVKDNLWFFWMCLYSMCSCTALCLPKLSILEVKLLCCFRDLGLTFDVQQLLSSHSAKLWAWTLAASNILSRWCCL